MAKKEITIRVTGMTCAACSTRIEKGLNRLEEANVNLALEKATIEFNPSQISLVDIMN